MSLTRVAVPIVVALAGAAVAAVVGAPWAGADAVKVRPGVVYRTVDGIDLRLDVYEPGAAGSERPAVVLVHGGGFRGGSRAAMRDEGRSLAARGWVAVSVDYRLGAAGRYPGPVDDVRAALGWLRARAPALGVDPDRVVALGSSAGGTLASFLATTGPRGQERSATVTAAVSWSGPTDFRSLTHGREHTQLPLAVGTFVGCPPGRCVGRALAASPVNHVDGRSAPVLLVNATRELVPHSQATAMAGALQEAGADASVLTVDGTGHGRALRPAVWRATFAFLESHVDHQPATSGARRLPITATEAAVVSAVALGVAARPRRHQVDQPLAPASAA